MKIKKSEIENFIKFLDVLPLKQKASRMRSKFKNLLVEGYKELMDDIGNIQKEYLVLDKEGNPINNNGLLEFTDIAKVNEELNELLNEDFVILENEASKDMIISVKYSVLESDIELKGADADFYNKICDLFEEVEG